LPVIIPIIIHQAHTERDNRPRQHSSRGRFSTAHASGHIGYGKVVPETQLQHQLLIHRERRYVRLQPDNPLPLFHLLGGRRSNLGFGEQGVIIYQDSMTVTPYALRKRIARDAEKPSRQWLPTIFVAVDRAQCTLEGQRRQVLSLFALSGVREKKAVDSVEVHPVDLGERGTVVTCPSDQLRASFLTHRDILTSLCRQFVLHRYPFGLSNVINTPLG